MNSFPLEKLHKIQYLISILSNIQFYSCVKINLQGKNRNIETFSEK